MTEPRTTAAALPEWLPQPPPNVEHALVAFPRRHVLLVTLNRPQVHNCLSVEDAIELAALWKWYDAEPALRCAVLTGAGDRAFCAGMDLKQRLALRSGPNPELSPEYPAGGFGGVANRTGKKPIVVACNGHAHGGGFEMVLNADVVFASPQANFRLPEVLRGVAALGGALPRCMWLFGHHRTMDLVLTGRTLSPEKAVDWGLVKEVVPRERLLERTLDYAEQIASAASPDSVIVSRQAAREAWETASVSRATARGQELWWNRLLAAPNAAEGLAAFLEKRAPRWVPSKL